MHLATFSTFVPTFLNASICLYQQEQKQLGSNRQEKNRKIVPNLIYNVHIVKQLCLLGSAGEENGSRNNSQFYDEWQIQLAKDLAMP